MPLQEMSGARFALLQIEEDTRQLLFAMLQFHHIFLCQTTLRQTFIFGFFTAHFALSLLTHLVDFLRDAAIDVGAGELFEQHTLFGRLCFEETSETSLRQNHSA